MNQLETRYYETMWRLPHILEELVKEMRGIKEELKKLNNEKEDTDE